MGAGQGKTTGEAAVARKGVSLKEKVHLGAPLHRGGGFEGVNNGCGTMPFSRKRITGQLGLFYWRKGKAGHAADWSSGLFLREIQDAAILLSAQPVMRGHFRGLGTVDGLVECNSVALWNATPRHNDLRMCSLSSWFAWLWMV